MRFNFELLRPMISLPLKPIATMKASILEFLHVFGLAIYTFSKMHFVYLTNRPISLPLKTFAIKLPLPFLRTRVAKFIAESTN